MNTPNNNFFSNGEENRSENFQSDQHFLGASSYVPYLNPMPPFYQHHCVAETGICDGMNDCHLADNWVNFMNQHLHLPITHFAGQIPILNSYMPSISNVYHYQHHAMYQKTHLENSFECQTQNQLNYEPSAEESLRNNHQKDNEKSEQQCKETYDNESEYFISGDHCGATASIKYQDRCKKIDFKKNFRDENRKINGCFYDSENDSKSRSEAAAVVPPPKKKWIKNYLTALTGT